MGSSARSDTGSFSRPDTGSSSRPDTGSFSRPDTGSFSRADTGSHRRLDAYTGSGFAKSDTGAQPRVDSFARSDTGSHRRLDADSRGRPSDTGSFARTDTGSHRRLDAQAAGNVGNTGNAGNADTGARRFVAPPIPDDTFPKQPRLVTVGMIILAVIVLFAGTAIGVVYFTGDDKSMVDMLNLGSSKNGKHAASGPLDNRTSASFEMVSGANQVHVTIGDLGDDLYRISTPQDAGISPSPVVTGNAVQLQLTPTGDGSGGEVEIELSAKVRWALRFSGYAEDQTLDLGNGKISGIEMVAAMKRARIALPAPTGTVPVKINGAVEQLTLQSPVGSPVRVTVGGGATSVVAGSRTLKKVPPGSTLTPKEWQAQNRYDVTTAAAVNTLTVQNLS